MMIGVPASAARGAGSGPAVDRSVLGEWLADDEDAINELLGVFRDSVRAELARMNAAITAGDLDEFAEAGHRMRGAALAMGAHALGEAVSALYATAKAQDRTACENGMPSLRAHVEQVIAEVPWPADPGRAET